MGFMQGEGRTQGALFPVCLEELIPDDHICRVIDVFVDRLDMAALEFNARNLPKPAGLAMIRGICSSSICTAIFSRSVPRDGWSRSADGILS